MTRTFSALAVVALLGGCATQPDYQRPVTNASAIWSAASGPPSTIDREGWWTLLHDPAIDALVAAGLRDNPTLAEAAARVDRARAALKVQDAGRTPSVGLEGSVTQSRDRTGGVGSSMSQSAAATGVRLGWELDLWGRVRAGSTAAQHRLSARTADAEAARLAVIGDIADAVLALRACQFTLDLRDRDITSRETELRIERARRDFGAIAPVAVTSAEGNLANARTERISQAEGCTLTVNALVALSGIGASEIRTLVAEHDQLPTPPPFTPALPATVLLAHPAVIAAEREAAARWSEIAIARADRLPRIDLVGVLTGQWIRALGASSSWVGGSAGVTLTMPLIDGGAGAANVRVAQADYLEALAQLDRAIRTAVREVEDGLAARQSAEARIETTAAAVDAARFTLRANEARWRAGAIAQFELEESRRQSNLAEESGIAAVADRARTWVALVRRAGSGPATAQTKQNGSDAQ